MPSRPGVDIYRYLIETRLETSVCIASFAVRPTTRSCQCSRYYTRVFFFFSFLFFSFISLLADGPHHYHPACGHKGSSHLSPVHALQFFLSRCKFSTLTTRQPMVEFYLLTFPRFPLRKKEHKSYFGKNRTHDFRTSRCAAYLLDHSGDERQLRIIIILILHPRSAPPQNCRLLLWDEHFFCHHARVRNESIDQNRTDINS